MNGIVKQPLAEKWLQLEHSRKNSCSQENTINKAPSPMQSCFPFLFECVMALNSRLYSTSQLQDFSAQFLGGLLRLKESHSEWG